MKFSSNLLQLVETELAIFDSIEEQTYWSNARVAKQFQTLGEVLFGSLNIQRGCIVEIRCLSDENDSVLALHVGLRINVLMVVLFLADSVPYLNIDRVLVRIKELHLLNVRNQRKTIFKIQIRSMMLHVLLNE